MTHCLLMVELLYVVLFCFTTVRFYTCVQFRIGVWVLERIYFACRLLFYPKITKTGPL